jgi:hypothetical protein
MKGLERRYLDRLEIPDAEVVYISDTGTEEKGSLADITKISVRFEVSKQFNPGDMIHLEIIIPNKEKIAVRGHVVRTINSTEAEPAYAAVQFLPFGSDERYNSMESYTQLDVLTTEYRQKVA